MILVAPSASLEFHSLESARFNRLPRYLTSLRCKRPRLRHAARSNSRTGVSQCHPWFLRSRPFFGGLRAAEFSALGKLVADMAFGQRRSVYPAFARSGPFRYIRVLAELHIAASWLSRRFSLLKKNSCSVMSGRWRKSRLKE